MKNKTSRNILILVVLAVTVYFLAPLFIHDLPDFWTSKRLKLGLDLQGGMQVTLDVDTSKIPDAEKDAAVKSAVEIIRNRIDQFGVAEPSIQRIGTHRILVQLPGLKDFGRAKGILGKTALLEFKLVASNDQTKRTLSKLDKYFESNINKYPELKKFAGSGEADVDILGNAKSDSAKTTDYSHVFTDLTSGMMVDAEYVELVQSLLKDQNVKKAIPSGLQVSLGREDKNSTDKSRALYVLLSHAELTGKYLKDAKVNIGHGYDPKTSGKAYISLDFNKKGAKLFANVTGTNIKKRLAIVLDGIVYMAPTIQDKIRNGQAIITGLGTIADASDLVIILKAGNLPAPVTVMEERAVGPTLGSDSIQAGLKSGLIGLLLVAIFMLVYYGLSGIIADFGLLVNMGFIMAMLTLLNGTLTMPGIAGMILTIGMSVDANVLIFERIREELRVGKTVRSAVDAGFNRAFVTILDANITTLITALVLYQFGTGPIRGFAVTLSIGIVGSMFSAIVLSRAIFEAFITNKNRNKLSI